MYKIKSLFLNKDYGFSNIINIILSSYKSLLLINILLFIVLKTESFFVFMPPRLFQQNQNIIFVFRSIVVLGTLFAHHFILFKNSSILKSLGQSIELVILNYLKYIQIVSIFIILYFGVVSLSDSFHFGSYFLTICKGSIFGLIKLVIMVIFHVLLTLFYIDVVCEENQGKNKV